MYGLEPTSRRRPATYCPLLGTCEENPDSLYEPSTLRHCGDITRAVYDAYDYHGIFLWNVIDGVGVLERYPQAGCKLFA